jgi:hypoxanthine-DNA glycosylase
MPFLRGLPFEPGGDPRILILGSFPGTLSLEAGAYYANPRNQFWKIMEYCFGIPVGSSYPEKLEGLKRNNLGLWDVILSCERQGAMDSAIRNATSNDIPLFLHDHPTVRIVIANGTTSGKYLRQFRPRWPSRVSLHVLPSTSPANARTPFSEKLRAWAVILEAGNDRDSQP